MKKVKSYVEYYLGHLTEMANSSSFAFVIWHLSLMMALWGGWLLLPLETFIGAPYQTMLSFASEMVWGGVAFFLGVGKMHFVTVKKTISLSMLNLISGYFWILVGVSFLFSIPSNTGGMVYIMLGLLEFWFYKQLQCRRNPKE